MSEPAGAPTAEAAHEEASWWSCSACSCSSAAASASGNGGAASPPTRGRATRRSRSIAAPIVAKVTATGTLSALVTVQVGSRCRGASRRSCRLQLAGEEGAGDREDRAGAVRGRARAGAGEPPGGAGRRSPSWRRRPRTPSCSTSAPRQLFERKAIAQAELDTARANACAPPTATLTAARGNLAQAKAALQPGAGEPGLHDHPVADDGVVISRSVDVGQTVAASLPAPTLFTIAEDLTKMQVDTSVAEADVGKLKPGHGRDVHRRRVSRRARSRATIRQIRNAPQTLQNVVTYDAVIDVDNPDLELQAGHDRQRDLRLRRARRRAARRRTRRCASSRRPSWRALAERGGGRRRRRAARRRQAAKAGGGAAAARQGGGGRAGGERRDRRTRLGAARRRRRRRCACASASPTAPPPRSTTASSREGDRVVTDAERPAATASRSRRQRRRRCSGGRSDGRRRPGCRPALVEIASGRPRSTSWATSRCTRCAA